MTSLWRHHIVNHMMTSSWRHNTTSDGILTLHQTFSHSQGNILSIETDNADCPRFAHGIFGVRTLGTRLIIIILSSYYSVSVKNGWVCTFCATITSVLISFYIKFLDKSDFREEKLISSLKRCVFASVYNPLPQSLPLTEGTTYLLVIPNSSIFGYTYLSCPRLT